MTSVSNSAPTGRSRVTIREVAREAGVGIKTVSRVVNGEPNVAPATAERVRETIARLQWEPDAHASNLRRTNTRTRTWGLLLGSVDNPFAAMIHRAIEDVAIHRDVAVFASSLDEDPAREVAAVEAFVRRKVDGLILTCAAGSQSYLAEVVPPEVPIVFIDREPSEFTADTVLSDNLGGSILATRHLLAQGHRRIAGLFDRSAIWTSQQRREGFSRAMADYDVSPAQLVALDDLTTPQAAEAAVLSLLSSPTAPTAIFSAQNRITVGAVHALRKLGRQHDVALVGFDDVELADLIDPGITVVAQRPAAMGQAAAERLFEQLDARGPRGLLPAVDTLLPVDLICRGSGEIRPPTASD